MPTLYAWTDEDNGTTWEVWATASSSATTDTVWLDWNTEGTWDTATTNYIACSADTWDAWNNSYTVFYREAEPETAEQQVAREERERVHAEELRMIQEARKEAEARADALLRETLSEEQRKEIAAHRYFTVESKTSKRRYRVRTDAGRHGNIDELDAQGRVVARLCCAPVGNIPDADALLGQALNLRYNEDEFRATANHTRVA